MKNYRILCSLFLSVVFSNLFLSCASDAESENEVNLSVSPRNIIALYPPNSLGDNSYYDDISYTLHVFARENNALMADIVPADSKEAEENLKTALETVIPGAENLILCADSLYLSFLEKYDLTPLAGRQILVLDAREQENTSISTVHLPDYGVSMLAGSVAKSLSSYFGTDVKCLCMLANETNPNFLDGMKGFIQGFGADWNGKIYNLGDFVFASDKKLDEYIKNTSFMVVKFDCDTEDGAWTGFNNNVQAYNIPDCVQDEDDFCFNFYYPLYGSTVRGLEENVRSNVRSMKNPFLFAGVNVKNSIFSESVPFYVVKHIDKVVSLCLSQWISDKKIPNYQEFGLETGFTELVVNDDYYVQWDAEQLKKAVEQTKEAAIKKEREYEAGQSQ
ncbi:MAG: hypothetical protein IJ257_07730 [Treponema sp.]|nr:hypothetical protein [Treponema sp.]